MAELGFNRSDVAELAVEVWRGFLSTEIEPLDESIRVEVPLPMLSACVTVKGTWYGGIVIHCPQSAAYKATARALGVDEPSAEDVLDVLGEAANMIAGRLKYLMPPNTQISLPIVAAGDQFRLSIAGAHEELSLAFVAEDEPFRIDIVLLDEETGL